MMQVWNWITAPLTTFKGRVVIGLLVLTGIVSGIINLTAGTADWAGAAQTLLALGFVISAALILSPEGGRLRLLAISAPALGAVILGLTVLPNQLLLLTGLAVGWVLAGSLIFRQQTPREITLAIRHMRKGEYKTAFDHIDALIKRDRDNPEHYRLRAMILRLDNKPDRARRDYDKMLTLAPAGANGDAIRAEAYDGLSETLLSMDRLTEAAQAAQAAHDLYPQNWVPLYTLGLIYDRAKQPQQAKDVLEQALALKIPDQRQRLLAYFYLVRAYRRLNDLTNAQRYAKYMEDMWAALNGLEKLLKESQSAPLSAVLAVDVQTARALMVEDIAIGDL